MLVLLDSNVWRYIVDADAVSKVQTVARKSRNRIAIAPAVVYEALRAKSPALRAALVSAMTLPSWKRLMPEAYSEAAEIKAEVKRLQPGWLRQPQDLTLFRRLRHDWIRTRGGFWDRVRSDTEGERQRVGGSDLLEKAREQALEARKEGEAMPSKWQTVRLTDLLASPPSDTPGWQGHPVELWRVNALYCFRAAMSMGRHPYIDWLDGEVDLDWMTFQAPELVSFWLYQVDALRMRRHWLRTAFEYQQRFHRVTDGTPADNQLGTYLADVDLALSADRNFVKFAERCRQEAPFPIGYSQAIPGGSAAVDSVLAALRGHV